MISSLREILPFFGTYRKVRPTLAATLLATVLQSLSLLALPLANKIIFDDLLVTRDSHLLVYLVLYILLFTAFATFSTLLVDAACAHLRTKLAAVLRRAMLERVLGYRMQFFADRDTGGLVQNMISDIDVIAQVLAEILQVFAYALQVAMLFAILALMDIDAMYLFAATFMVYLAWMLAWKRPVEASSKRIGDSYKALYGFFFEMLPGVKEIKLQGLQDYVLERLGATSATLKRQQMLNAMSNSCLWIGTISFPWITFCALLILGVRKLEAGEVTIGTIATLFVIMRSLFSPVEKISSIFNSFNNAIPAARRVNSLRGDHGESGSGGPRPAFREGIAFRRVTFSYDGGRKSLDGVDLDFPKGSRVAIVGRSGSGKSTLLNLLLKFNYGYEGRILLDGRELSALGAEQVRALCCVVVQDPFLFNTTIRGNIDFTGKMPDSEVLALCEQVHLGPFIRSLPQGIDTPIGERAARISGGEKQRIALARALARSAPILVLDEATSALDPATERRFRDTVRGLWEARGLTVITITHRAPTARDSDLIYLMEGGKVLESGSHEELVAAKGAYHRLFTEDVPGPVPSLPDRDAVVNPSP